MFLTSTKSRDDSVLEVSLWDTTIKIHDPANNPQDFNSIALARLLRELVSIKAQESPWIGDMMIRFKLVRLMHDALHPKDFDEATFRAVLHWSLTLGPSVYLRENDPSSLQEAGVTWENNLQDFVSVKIITYPLESLEVFCKWVTSDNFLGLPPSRLSESGQIMQRILTKSQESEILTTTRIKDLLLQFTDQETSKPEDSTKDRDQQKIISPIMLNIVSATSGSTSIESSAESQDVMGRWLVLLSHNLIGEDLNMLELQDWRDHFSSPDDHSPREAPETPDH
jgi:hypothetical protein